LKLLHISEEAPSLNVLAMKSGIPELQVAECPAQLAKVVTPDNAA
jgi:hypothetical protein